MREILAQVIEVLLGARRFRWHAMLLAWSIVIAGSLLVYSMPNVYEARARVYVDTESVLKPLLTGLAVNTDVMSQVNLMSTALLSRPNLERVARETDLHLRASTPEEMERLLESLPGRIRLQTGARDNTYLLSYSDSDRTMAQRVVQTLLNSFVEDTLGIKRQDTTSAQRFLELKIKDYEKLLNDAEEKLAAFKKENVGLLPGETGDYYTRLQTAMQTLDDLRAKYRLASDRHNELTRQLQGEEPSFGLVAGPRAGPASPYDAKIAELQKKVDALLLQYTEKHPDVIAYREQIQHLQELKQSAEPPPPADTPDIDPSRLALRQLDINPVYQNMKIMLSQTDVELAELKGRIAEQERQVRDLQARTSTIPEVEAQLKRLNRDYEVNKAQHTALLQRLESARLSEQAEENTGDVKFRIIDPPAVPLAPSGPPRLLLLTAVLLLSLVAGVALAVALNHVRPVFSTRSMLRNVTSMPVLGSVFQVPTPAGVLHERRQALLLAGAMGMLVMFYVVALLLSARLASPAGVALG